MFKRLFNLISKSESVSTESKANEKLIDASLLLSGFQFLRLPSELLIIIYTEWLGALNLFQIDCAICSKQHRPEWLQFLKDICQFKSVELNERNRQAWLSWLTSRCVRVSELVLIGPDIYSARFKRKLERWLKHCGSEVHTVVLNTCEGYTVQCIRERCNNVRKIVLSNVISMQPYWGILRAKSDAIVTLSILASLDCSICEVIPANLRLRSVRNLTVDMRLFSENQVFIDFLTRFPSLQNLALINYRLFSYLVGKLNRNELLEILPNLKTVRCKDSFSTSK